MSSSILSWQILTVHAQPFRGAWDLAFCLKVPLDSMLVWASSRGSGETARMRRLAWTFAARIGDKYQIRLTRPILLHLFVSTTHTISMHACWRLCKVSMVPHHIILHFHRASHILHYFIHDEYTYHCSLSRTLSHTTNISSLFIIPGLKCKCVIHGNLYTRYHFGFPNLCDSLV